MVTTLRASCNIDKKVSSGHEYIYCFLLGGVVWIAYGCFVNVPRWDFGRLFGIYVCFFFLVAQVNQTLWKPTMREDDSRGVRMFLVYGQTPGDVSAIDHHLGEGLTWTGPFQGRHNDMIKFSPQYAHLSDSVDLPKSYELAYEGFYQYQLTPAISLQPDLQYIVNPGGEYSNALVGFL